MQASHAPEQVVLQQTPSTQLPLAHWLVPVHAPPLASFAAHELPLQYALEAQSASAAHVDGQEALLPLHIYGAHEGLPEDPAATLVHVPTDPDTLQASHEPEHAVLQQYPSMQLPLAHVLLPAQAVPLAVFATHDEPLQ